MNTMLTSAPALVLAVGDPDGTRRMTAVIALLAVLGIGLVMLAVWLFRLTRPDPDLLAPLEMMGERKWRRADPVWQRRRLDQVRPPDAAPLQPSAAPPDLDEGFDDGPAATGFDDLHADALEAEGTALPPPEGAPTPDRVPATATDIDADTDADTDNAGGLAVPDSGPESGGEPVVAPGAELPDPIGESVTPPGMERPVVDEWPHPDLDPDLLAKAMAEIDAELAHRPSTPTLFDSAPVAPEEAPAEGAVAESAVPD